MADQNSKAIGTVQIENSVVRVVLWRIPPGANIGRHRHVNPYVVIPITGGELTIEETSGNSIATMLPGQSYSRNVPLEHDLRNDTDNEVAFVEVELLTAQVKSGDRW